MTTTRRTKDAYEHLQRTLEWPMLVLSIAFTVALLLPLLVDLAGTQRFAVESIMWFVWAAFVVEYLALLYIAPDRRHMIRTHLLDLLIIVLPVLRPLRILRLLRLFTVVGRATVAFRRVFNRPGFQAFLVAAGVIVVTGAGLVYVFERGNPQSTFAHFGDALWWAIVTSTTVGYGDHYPVTAAARGVAVVLMLVGIGLFSVVTANIAAYFVESDTEPQENHDLAARLDRIESLLRDRAPVAEADVVTERS